MARNATQQTQATAKATAPKRNLDPIDVYKGDDFKIVVSPTTHTGTLTESGARVYLFKANSTRAEKSIPGSAWPTLTKHAKQVREAIDTVEQRAHIGAHRPTAEPVEA